MAVKTKNKSIQGLRFVFILGIFLSHATFLGNYNTTAHFFKNYISQFADVGFFFIISGYFTALTYKNEQTFTTYFSKKLKKLYPLHILMLLIVVLPSVLHGSLFENYDIFSLLTNVFLIQSWFPASIVSFINPVAWFLSSIMFCYIVGYFLIKCINNNRKIGIILLSVLTALLLIYKVFFSILYPNVTVFDIGYHLVYRCPLAGLCDYLLGIVIYILFDKLNFVKNHALTFQIISLILIIFMFITKHLIKTGYSNGFYSIPFNVLLIVSFLFETKFSRCIFGNKVLAYLGDISFEIFLSHEVIMMILLSKLNILNIISEKISPYITLLLILLAVIVFSIVYSFVYNKIIIKFRSKKA